MTSRQVKSEKSGYFTYGVQLVSSENKEMEDNLQISWIPAKLQVIELQLGY